MRSLPTLVLILAPLTLVLPTASAQAPPPPSLVSTPATAESTPARIAREIAAACPSADPADPAARDESARCLARLNELIDSIDTFVLWSAASADGDAPRTVPTRIAPMPFVKVYLSLFMLRAEPIVRSTAAGEVIELPVAFRAGLRPAEYPEPIWSTPEWWASYAGAQSIILTFRDGVLTSALRRSADRPDHERLEAQRAVVARGWQSPSPRGSSLDFLLWPENPDGPALRSTYTALRARFQSHGCLQCHSPAPQGRAVILDQPVQALAAADALPAFIRSLATPGPARGGCGAPPIADREALAELQRLAQAFADQSSTALSFEAARRALHTP